jgi:prolyl 4-hydroxylase
MQSRSSSSQPSSFKSLSISSLIQYVFFAAVLYVLAGAPLQGILYGTEERLATGEVKGLQNLVVPDEGLVCGKHGFRGVHVLSREPLVVYVEGFLSVGEAEGVVGLR